MKWPLIWTDLAKSDIENNLEYLRRERDVQTSFNFLLRLAESLEIVSANASTFQIIHRKLGIRRFILNKRIVLYYQLNANHILLLTFWNTSKDSKVLKKTLRKIATVKRKG